METTLNPLDIVTLGYFFLSVASAYMQDSPYLKSLSVISKQLRLSLWQSTSSTLPELIATPTAYSESKGKLTVAMIKQNLGIHLAIEERISCNKTLHSAATRYAIPTLLFTVCLPALGVPVSAMFPLVFATSLLLAFCAYSHLNGKRQYLEAEICKERSQLDCLLAYAKDSVCAP